jgi:hypothetical protein
VSGCVEWTGRTNGRGYGKDGKTYAHRDAWELANGPIPAGMVICHSCDNPLCVNPDHLFLGTQKENMQDAGAKGRLAKPYRLTTGQARSVREKYAAGGTTIRAIAGSLGVSYSLIYRAIKLPRRDLDAA